MVTGIARQSHELFVLPARYSLPRGIGLDGNTICIGIGTIGAGGGAGGCGQGNGSGVDVDRRKAGGIGIDDLADTIGGYQRLPSACY